MGNGDLSLKAALVGGKGKLEYMHILLSSAHQCPARQLAMSYVGNESEHIFYKSGKVARSGWVEGPRSGDSCSIKRLTRCGTAESAGRRSDGMM